MKIWLIGLVSLMALVLAAGCSGSHRHHHHKNKMKYSDAALKAVVRIA